MKLEIPIFSFLGPALKSPSLLLFYLCRHPNILWYTQDIEIRAKIQPRIYLPSEKPISAIKNHWFNIHFSRRFRDKEIIPFIITDRHLFKYTCLSLLHFSNKILTEILFKNPSIDLSSIYNLRLLFYSRYTIFLFSFVCLIFKTSYLQVCALLSIFKPLL